MLLGFNITEHDSELTQKEYMTNPEYGLDFNQLLIENQLVQALGSPAEDLLIITSDTANDYRDLWRLYEYVEKHFDVRGSRIGEYTVYDLSGVKLALAYPGTTVLIIDRKYFR